MWKTNVTHLMQHAFNSDKNRGGVTVSNGIPLNVLALFESGRELDYQVVSHCTGDQTNQ